VDRPSAGNPWAALRRWRTDGVIFANVHKDFSAAACMLFRCGDVEMDVNGIVGTCAMRGRINRVIRSLVQRLDGAER